MILRTIQILVCLAFGSAAIYFGNGELNGYAIGFIAYFGAYFVTLAAHRLFGLNQTTVPHLGRQKSANNSRSVIPR